MLESGGSVDDDEVKEVFDDEAIRRKLRGLCAFLFTVEESKEVPLPEILFMGRRTHWKIVSKEYFRKMLSVVTKGQEQMVLAQGVPKELGDETSVLVITLSDFSLHTLKPEK